LNDVVPPQSPPGVLRQPIACHLIQFKTRVQCAVGDTASNTLEALRVGRGEAASESERRAVALPKEPPSEFTDGKTAWRLYGRVFLLSTSQLNLSRFRH
jgi:hypothetical protein